MVFEASISEESNFALWMLDIIFHDIHNCANASLNYLYLLEKEDIKEPIFSIISQVNNLIEIFSTTEKI